MIELKGHADPFKAPSNADLFTWNDAPGRTAQDVIGALEAIGTTPDHDWDGWLQVLTVNDDASVEVRELVSV